jgi:hypothetical protein
VQGSFAELNVVVAPGVPEVLPIGGVGPSSGGCAIEVGEHVVLAAAVLVVEAEEHPGVYLCEAYWSIKLQV